MNWYNFYALRSDKLNKIGRTNVYIEAASPDEAVSIFKERCNYDPFPDFGIVKVSEEEFDKLFEEKNYFLDENYLFVFKLFPKSHLLMLLLNAELIWFPSPPQKSQSVDLLSRVADELEGNGDQE
jgi:hypothetical protein